MAENEKQIISNMEAAIAALPEEKKQFFLGFAEGVAAMAEQLRDRRDATIESSPPKAVSA